MCSNIFNLLIFFVFFTSILAISPSPPPYSSSHNHDVEQFDEEDVAMLQRVLAQSIKEYDEQLLAMAVSRSRFEYAQQLRREQNIKNNASTSRTSSSKLSTDNDNNYNNNDNNNQYERYRPSLDRSNFDSNRRPYTPFQSENSPSPSSVGESSRPSTSRQSTNSRSNNNDQRTNSRSNRTPQENPISTPTSSRPSSSRARTSSDSQSERTNPRHNAPQIDRVNSDVIHRHLPPIRTTNWEEPRRHSTDQQPVRSGTRNSNRSSTQNRPQHQTSQSQRNEFEEVDRMFDENKPLHRIQMRLLQIAENQKNSIEVLWRRARICLARALDMASTSSEWNARVEVLDEGMEYTERAMRINPRDLPTIKIHCLLLGSKIGDKTRQSQKIQLALQVDMCLDKADQTDPEILHARGRLMYALAKLNAIQRAVAGRTAGMKELMAKSSIEEAIKKLLQAQIALQGQSIENSFYLAKCYQRVAEKSRNNHEMMERAIKLYEHLVELQPRNRSEGEKVEETREILRKLNVY